MRNPPHAAMHTCRARRRRIVAALAMAVLLAGPACAPARAATVADAASPALVGATAVANAPRFDRIMTIVLENTNYAKALEQPFLASLAARGAILTDLSAEGHPSQPNYIALVSGSTHGVDSDGNVTLDARHIGDLLEAKGLKWKVYAERYPGNCFLGSGAPGGYVRKHVPFLSFRDVQASPSRCARIVKASALWDDVRNGTLPDYSLYIPDEKNDGHNTGVSYADHWLETTFGPLLRDPRFMKGMLLVVTFDESRHRFLPFFNGVLTVVVGDSVVSGSKSDRSYSHYSLLRLVEDRFGLGNLGAEDAKAPAITGIWK